jgi:gas vesicle protein
MAFRRESAAKHWARLALKTGLLLTDAKLWQAVNDQIRDHAEDIGDDVKRKYEDATDRLQNASDALRGTSNDWVAPLASFVGGIGIGIGLGILFAPNSGEETRAALRDRAADVTSGVKNKVGDFVSGSSRFRSRGVSTENRPSTGTEGD